MADAAATEEPDQRAEQHVAQDVGLRHGAGDLADEQLGKG